jgi:hypothetical protein
MPKNNSIALRTRTTTTQVGNVSSVYERVKTRNALETNSNIEDSVTLVDFPRIYTYVKK